MVLKSKMLFFVSLSQTSPLALAYQKIITLKCIEKPNPMFLVSFASQLQLTQRIPVPQEPVSIIVPIVYDMATGLTQQADIPRQHSSSGAAALMVSNILKRFNELHPARQGKTHTEQFTVFKNWYYIYDTEPDNTVYCKVPFLTLCVLSFFQASVRYLHLFMS